MSTNNIIMLQTVAFGLEEFRDRMVFVGGVVAELYADDPAASEIRPTQDVDCTIELRTRMEHAALEEALREKGFANDISRGAPICRWLYHNIKVDVMPADEKIRGFNSRWYSRGIENRIPKTLPDGTDIFVFPPEYYLASKFEAHHDRGGNDLRQSHDFEDIIYIIDNCIGLLDIIKNAKEDVKNYLKTEFEGLIIKGGLSEGIECALPYGSDSNRLEIIEDIILRIAGIDKV